MPVNPHDPETCITLSPAILAHLKSKSMPPGALKVYIYLCARYTGRSFSASTTQLKEATGLEARSVIAAVKVLCGKKLITRHSQGGNRPNEFAILLPKSRESTTPQTEKAMLPSAGLKQPTPAPATTTETCTLEQIPAAPQAKPDQAVALPPVEAAILERIATSYRRLTTEEWIQVKQAYLGEAVLSNKLETLKLKGGVGPDMAFEFFMNALGARDTPSNIMQILST